MAAENFGWLAGIIEGEGHFEIRSSGGRIRVSMSDRDVIYRLQRMAGGTVREVAPHFPGHKDQWLWSISKRATLIPILIGIIPYLGERRKSKAKEMLQNASIPARPRGKKNPLRGTKGRWV